MGTDQTWQQPLSGTWATLTAGMSSFLEGLHDIDMNPGLAGMAEVFPAALGLSVTETFYGWQYQRRRWEAPAPCRSGRLLHPGVAHLEASHR